MIRTACLAGSLAACLAMAAPIATAQQTDTPTLQRETTIVLRGEGELRLPPDYAALNVGVQVESRTAADAMQKQRTRMNTTLAALKASGLADRDIQTSSLSLTPQYDYPENQRPRLRGYVAGNVVTVKVRDLGKLGGVLDAAVDAGSNNIDDIRFGLEDDAKALREARQLAVRDANAKAADYASAMGYKVKRIVNLSEPNLNQGGGFERIIVTGAKVGGGSTPIEPGEILVQQLVNVTFELER